MKTLRSFLGTVLSIKSYDTVCDACSYYNDGVVDDISAFVPHVTAKRGWISKYVKERLLGK